MSLGGNYRRLWASSGFANVGDGLLQAAVAVYAVELTRSPGLVSLVALSGRLPWLLFALPAGALADRLDRRRTMFSMNVVRAVLLAVLAAVAVAGAGSIPIVATIAFGLGCAEVLFDTAAQTLMPSLVASELLDRANGRLYAVEMVANQFVGPPLGGVLVAASAGLAFGVSAALYAVAAFALALIVGSFRPAPPAVSRRMRTDIAEGIRYLAGHRLLRTLALILGGMNLLFTAFTAVFPLWALSEAGLGLSEAAFGVLLTAGAAGGVVGSFATAAAERLVGRSRILAATILAGSVSLVAPALTESIAAIAVVSVVAGAAAVMWNVLTVSLRQRIIPNRLLGRVNAGYRLLAWGSMPIGAALGGVVGEVFGLPAVFLTAGVLHTLLLIPLLLVVTDAALVQAEQPAPA